MRFDSPEMQEDERAQLSWQLQAPVVKHWVLPKWIPRTIRRFVHSFEPDNEAAFIYFCKWVAFNRYYSFDESHLLVAADATRMAGAFGISRMEIVKGWAYAGREYDPDFED